MARRWTRWFAGGIAGLAWLGLGVQCWVVWREQASIALTMWIVLGFFTITTNLLVAIVFTAICLGSKRAESDGVVAGTMLAIVLVGAVYALLLDGLVELSGGSALANALLHRVTPVSVPVFWATVTSKGGLRWKKVLVWTVYPLTYLAYALVRGGATGRYAYPFLDVGRLGLGRVLGNSAGIAMAYVFAGVGVVWVDHLLGGRAGRAARL